MTNVFVATRGGVSLTDLETEQVLGQVMKEVLGFRTPTTKYGTWLKRFDDVTEEQYEEVVYQELLRAWLFTKSRTKLEGRKVPKEVFIRSYVQMIDNLSIVKETFNDAISYRVVDNSVGYVKGRMPRMVDDLLDVVPRFYTRQELEDLLDD